MLPLSTVLANTAISVLAACGMAFLFQLFFGDNTELKRFLIMVLGIFTAVTTCVFLLVHIK
jgi:hypothetical protein